MLQTFPSVNEQVAAATAVLLAKHPVKREDVRHLFVPYRISPLGAHIDHQGGHVLGRTVKTGTVLVYAPLSRPEIHLSSRNFREDSTFIIGDPVQPRHWVRYAQAAALALHQTHVLTHGYVGVISGTMVGAGLSSSASAGLAYLRALADVNNITLGRTNLLELDSQLEHTYLGLQNGILDQSSILYGEKNALVHIDTRSRAVQLISDPPQAEKAGWLIAYSGIARELTIGGGYNQRVSECQEAAQWLSPTAVTLSDVPPNLFVARSNTMPENLRRRAAHFFGEVARVTDGVQAWQAGDLAAFGQLMNDSCTSSIYQYESGQKAVVALQEIVSHVPGVFGSRFSGGGYGGCVVGLVERAKAKQIAAEITQAYRQQFPELAQKAAVYWSENGVHE